MCLEYNHERKPCGHNNVVEYIFCETTFYECNHNDKGSRNHVHRMLANGTFVHLHFSAQTFFNLHMTADSRIMTFYFEIRTCGKRARIEISEWTAIVWSVW